MTNKVKLGTFRAMLYQDELLARIDAYRGWLRLRIAPTTTAGRNAAKAALTALSAGESDKLDLMGDVESVCLPLDDKVADRLTVGINVWLEGHRAELLAGNEVRGMIVRAAMTRLIQDGAIQLDDRLPDAG